MTRSGRSFRRAARLTAASGAVVALGIGLAACSHSSEGESFGARETEECSALANEAISELNSGNATSVDAEGREGVSANELTLTDEEISELKEMAPRVAVFMHRTDDDSANAIVTGMEAAIEDYGMELLTVSSADSDVSKQVSDLETILAQNPDGIAGIPIDASATAAAWQKVADAGTELVFTDYAPDGFTPGDNYVTVVSNDDRSNGRIDGHLLARGMGCTGKVGLIPYADHSWFSNYERYLGVNEALKDYPDIEIVEETEIAGPDFAGDGEKAASAMLTKHADLGGIWSFWATPGSGVVQAVKQSGRTDVVTTTNDLTEPAGIDILEEDVIYGLASGQYREQGYTEITALAMSLLGKNVPEYVVLPAYSVDQSNVLEAWEDIFATEPPQGLIESAEAAQ